MPSLNHLSHRYFDREAARFDAIYQDRKPLVQRLVDALFRRVIHRRYELVVNAVSAPGRSILDVGCGSGRYGIELARRRAARCVGVDAASAMIDLARSESARQGLSDRCSWEVSEYLSWKSDATFDVVLAMGYFDYLEEPEPHLDKMIAQARSLVFASFPKRWEPRVPLRKLRFKLAAAYVRFYSKREARALFERMGGLPFLAVIDLGRDYIAIFDVGSFRRRA